MTLPKPYWTDGQITLYHGDGLELMPLLQADTIVTDPPYGATSLIWDAWPSGWPDIAAKASSQLWCFGSLSLFMRKASEFTKWNFAQDLVWEKHNGSNSFADRFRRVHESIVHFYRGTWAAVHKQPQFTNDAVRRSVQRSKNRTQHWGDIGQSAFQSEDGGPRLTASVLYVRSCHGHAVHPTQKPEGILSPLVLYSVPRDGVVLDPFAGSGSTLLAAKKAGRRSIGIELRKEYCDMAIERFSQQEMLPT